MAVQPPAQAPAPAPPPDETPQPQPEGRVLTLLEHFQELRYRLFVSSVALVAGVGVSLWPLTGWFIEFLKEPARDRVPNFQTYFFDPLEGWTTYFRVSLLLGLTMAMPVLVYQLLAFVGPGLTKSERRWLYPIVLGASGAFVGGVGVGCYG